ncbi:PREDICTED: uncharacterized protein LOC106746586 [Dinoponera quadriceps]|uniref:Glycosyltransferase family 92 protein n=1 Tax=Dinoponera quadriceps TaxID=609295 RepID=A0A6P3XLG4_DINQU|nr:PREDICTED: uncharacterized protein LOC106746586 [Dinoponera quadriceps]
MKKYYQAALVVTAVTSLICLLVYRHQYYKLRYVLEVFNYFGKYEPRGANGSCVNFDSTLTAFNSKFDEPIPSWQRLENDLYVYSAYSIDYRTRKEIRAIGVGNITSVFNMQCLVFFESESKPILGNFNFVPISKYYTSNYYSVQNFMYKGYHFVCGYSGNETATGITFVTKSNRYLNYAPIIPIKTLPQNLDDNSRTSVCVMQSSVKSMLPNTIDMMGFVSFHALVGMNNFIVYDNGIPNRFNSRLKRMANDPSSFQKFTYTVVPWNFPFTEIDETIAREIAVADCLYRSYNNVAYSVVLSWNEYVVPRYHRTTVDLIADIRRTESASDRYGLKSKFFCTQQSDNKKHVNSTLTLFKKTKTGIASKDHFVYIYHPHEMLHAELQGRREIRTTQIGQNLISVNQYKHCDGNMKVVEDSTVFRFVEDLQNSWIFKKYREFDMPYVKV